ncbi:MAG: formate dehydrogenase accessory sulfurtransferase FdhD [Chloroflexota bacterium]
MDGTRPTNYLILNGGAPKEISSEIVDEALACISLNGEEIGNFMCSPNQLELLALGFLANEGIIQSMDEVHHIHLAKSGLCADVWLHDTSVTKPEKTVITAGCGAGITFDDLSERHDPLEIDPSFSVTQVQLSNLMRQMHLGATLYQRSRGIHTAALADLDKIILQVEDIGRHNCIDKLRGLALKEGIETKGKILLSSGRISSEMANKARVLGTPIVLSRTSPTSLSVALAESWNMTLVGYLRQNRMRIYTHAGRIVATHQEVESRK